MSGKMPKGAPLSAYLYTILRANSSGLREMMAMSDASFEAVLEEYGLTAKWEARGLERGLEKGLEKGIQKGLQRGLKKGLQQGLQKGREEGKEEGREEGIQKGLQKGREEGREEAVRRLQKYGMEPKQIAEALELPLGTVFRYLKAE
jgi:flagellar biosynthesis/type III secretory pathway protein FliH